MGLLIVLVLLVASWCTALATGVGAPCDPGLGAPQQTPSCADLELETGWLTVGSGGRLFLEPFRTYWTNAEGRAYAEKHGLEYPFSNDHLDVSIGTPRPVELDPDTICTGAIMMGYEEPLDDHVVDCDEIFVALRVHQDVRMPAAVWSDGGRVAQFSELYRP